MNLAPLLLQLKQFIRPIIPLLRHHFFAAGLITLSFLIYSVWFVDQLLSKPTDEEYYTQKISSGIKTDFDKDTIAKISQLKKSGEQAPTPLPSNGRVNPFAE